MNPAPGSSLKHDDALDGLRALAVGAVILTHAFPRAVPGGWIGVDVFFVLSGFLITTILRHERESTGTIDFRAFYIRRTLRLVPALVLFVSAGLAIAAVKGHSFGEALAAAAFALTYTMNWNLAFSWGPGWLFAHTWSLAIEEQFYLLWPAVFLLIRGRRPARWLALALVAEIVWRAALVDLHAIPLRTYAGFDTHSDGLLAGCILGLWRVPHWVERRLSVLGLAAALVFAAIACTLAYDSPAASLVGIPAASLASAVALLCAQRPGLFRSVLSSPALRYLGRISYGIYLWHFLLLTIGEALWPGPGLFIGLAAIVPVAAASYELFEKRFLRLKDVLAPRRVRAVAPIAGSVAIPALGS